MTTISNDRIRELTEKFVREAAGNVEFQDILDALAEDDEIGQLAEDDFQADPFGDACRTVRDLASRSTVTVHLPDSFPIVTLCGSMRFYPRMLELAGELTSAGQIVLMPHDASLTGIPDKTKTEHGAMLDEMHRAKIRLSQRVLVVNTGGYVGESTRSEIEYANSLGIPVEYDEPGDAKTAPSTKCPGTNVIGTREEILKGCETFHAIPIVETGDDGEGGLVAFGHHEPRRVLAALLAYCRSRGMDLSDLDITNPAAPHAPQLVERAAKWAVFYRHAGAELTEQDWHEDGWCTCTEYFWWADQAEETTPGAIAAMWWNF